MLAGLGHAVERRLSRGISTKGTHMDLVHRIHRDPADSDGQGLAEYALILALIAIVSIVALIFLGGEIADILSKIGASI
jgi:Flp pilus assembly pilin Flp